MMEGYQKFRLLDAAFVIGSILTFIADQATDVILGVTFWVDGFPVYSVLVLLLVLVPNAIVQIFSARWNSIDEYSSSSVNCIHALLLGTLHRYYRVLTLGLEARRTKDVVDYQRYYQQWSDICMLRLFDSFMESAPQLVFQLYVLIEVSDWNTFNVSWTCISAVSSIVSLGWGVAAYSQALRMVREDKSLLTWLGMVLQTVWRFSMLSARIVALVLLCLTLHKWVFVVIGAHWALMTGWVIWQNTDFCTSKLEERLYNAVVGVIYCFCFFNLKEGRSRYRMLCFYIVMFVENSLFVGAYYWFSHHRTNVPVTWFSLGASLIVLGGTLVGLISLLLYYRYFHPAGPISPWSKTLDLKGEQAAGESEAQSPDFTIKDATYVEEKEKDISLDLSPEQQKKKSSTLKHSRSFKYHNKVNTTTKPADPIILSPLDLVNSSNGSHGPAASPTNDQDCCKVSDRLDSAYGTDSNRTASRNTESSQHTCTLVEKSPTGSYAVAGKSPTGSYNNQHQLNNSGSSQHDRSGSSLHNRSSSSTLHNRSNSSAAFNNETYMSINKEDESYMSLNSPTTNTTAENPNNTYQSVHPLSDTSLRSDQDTSQGSQASRLTVVDTTSSTPCRPPQDLLKRSPVLRDVTGFTPIPQRKEEGGTKERLHAPLTIIIPNISNQAITKPSSTTSPDKWSEKTISLDILNPETRDVSSFSGHDYENLALVNINRAPLGQHWRTYSDMANSRHDDSTKYEANKLNFTSSSDYSTYSNLAFCDIYPLSRALKDQLYRSLTPVSTAATMASSIETSDSNHTYEPIETAEAMSGAARANQAPLTLIHHDGRKVTANRIVSLDTLREQLEAHDKVPYDDPECRGDLYILAPMRLLTPVLEESESEVTRSKLYQSMTSGASSQIYSDVDSSIMSVLSEVLNLRTDSRMSRSVSGFPDRSASRLQTIEEDSVDTCSLLHTIEEIRNSSLCNLYYSSNSDLSRPLANVPPNQHPPLAPRVPPRNTAGYSSLVKENQQGGKAANHAPADIKVVNNNTPDLNESIKSVHSNTLVVTPPTVKAKNPKSAHLNGRGGVRKNILNLVGSTNDILNTPKRVKLPGCGGSEKKLALPPVEAAAQQQMSDSLMSEHNEFKSLVPHLTSQGAKFLSKVKANSGTESDLESSRNTSVGGYNGDFTTFTDTPSPKVFVRNFDQKPRRKFSILRQRFDEAGDDGDNSDYKYGFMPENPDAKYGFGVFGLETSYNLVETAKLSSGSMMAAGRSAPNIPGSYSLSALNRGPTDFKLGPDQQYANFARDSWSSASLQRRPSRAGGIGDRGDVTRRSMSILDDYEEKENIGPPRPLVQPKRRPPLAPLNKTSPMKILGNNIHSPQTRVYQLNPNRSTLSPTSKIFRKKSES